MKPGVGGGQWLPRASLGQPPVSGHPQQPIIGQPQPPVGGQPDTLMPQLPAVPTMSVSTTSGSRAAGGDDVNFDDLARRFEELKKRK